MEIIVDRTTCTGLGTCAWVVPDLFRVNDGGEPKPAS
jgi:ferredoxin